VHGLASDGDVAWWATATAFDLEGDEEPCPGRPHAPTQLRLFRIDDDGVREFAVPGVFPRTVAIAVSPTTVPGQLYIALVHGDYVAPQCDGADYKIERLTVEVPQD